MTWFLLAYHHATYWLVGTSPEQHHYDLAMDWYALRRFRNCVDQCKKFLSYSDSDDIKSMMAYCYWALADWDAAVSTYRSLGNIWSEPAHALRLAEAELRCGRSDEARKIVATVEVSYPNPTSHVAIFLGYINKELDESAEAE